MTKFVGKFRKNGSYDGDYAFEKKRHRNEHSESKKVLKRMIEEDQYYEEKESKNKKSKLCIYASAHIGVAKQNLIFKSYDLIGQLLTRVGPDIGVIFLMCRLCSNSL